jgi:hypothetical protein
MIIDQTQYDDLSRKAVKVISPEVIRSMSAAQRRLLNQALGRILEKRKSVDLVTPAEIEGQYEQIVQWVLTTGAHEHLLYKKDEG